MQSGAANATRRLDQSGVRTVLEGVSAQAERALRELSKDAPEMGRASSVVRAALKQLDALSGIATELRPQLTELSGLAHQLLEAAIGKKGVAENLGDSLVGLSSKIADAQAPLISEELGAASPIGKKGVDDLLSLTGQGASLLRELARMYPGADAFGGIGALTAKLDKDLGGIKQEISALMKGQKISPENIEAFFKAFAEVRQGFNTGAAKGDDFQRTNWVHTRIEVLHTLQAAKEQGLNAKQTLAAALGALASDSFKDSTTFSLLWHNRGGAELVLPLIFSRHFAGDDTLLADARRVALEHQITPPIFMSGAMKFFVGVDAPGVEEIVQKIDNPNAAPQVGGEIQFSPEALASLRAKGIPGWAVLEPGSRHHAASLAAIVGDVLQYPGLDGVIKYAFDIRDPEEKRPFMRDKLIKEAVNSSLMFSFGQGIKVVEDDKLQKMAGRYQAEMGALIEKQIYPEVDRRLRASLGVDANAPIPYWSEPVEAPLKDGQRAVVDLVKRTLAAVASEKGGVPLDPFGHVARANGDA